MSYKRAYIEAVDTIRDAARSLGARFGESLILAAERVRAEAAAETKAADVAVRAAREAEIAAEKRAYVAETLAADALRVGLVECEAARADVAALLAAVQPLGFRHACDAGDVLVPVPNAELAAAVAVSMNRPPSLAILDHAVLVAETLRAERAQNALVEVAALADVEGLGSWDEAWALLHEIRRRAAEGGSDDALDRIRPLLVEGERERLDETKAERDAANARAARLAEALRDIEERADGPASLAAAQALAADAPALTRLDAARRAVCEAVLGLKRAAGYEAAETAHGALDEAVDALVAAEKEAAGA